MAHVGGTPTLEAERKSAADHPADGAAGGFPSGGGGGRHLGAKLPWRGERSRVAGMASTEKIKPRELVVGGRYLHRNGLFIRQIEAIEGNTVHYHDQESSWSCSNSVFVRTCPTVATPEDEARVAGGQRKR